MNLAVVVNGDDAHYGLTGSVAGKEHRASANELRVAGIHKG